MHHAHESQSTRPNIAPQAIFVLPLHDPAFRPGEQFADQFSPENSRRIGGDFSMPFRGNIIDVTSDDEASEGLHKLLDDCLTNQRLFAGRVIVFPNYQSTTEPSSGSNLAR